jgi:hypothetical protein
MTTVARVRSATAPLIRTLSSLQALRVRRRPRQAAARLGTDLGAKDKLIKRNRETEFGWRPRDQARKSIALVD